MKLIKFLKKRKIPFYIYQLNKEDCIILNNINSNNNNIIIVLSGFIFINKVFSNKEILPIAILDRKAISIQTSKELKTYYKLIALEKTYILTINKNIITENRMNIFLTTNILIRYYKTIERYEAINNIMIHKYITNRILQLVFNICIQFGKIKNKKVSIPFQLSSYNIAILTGTSENTVNKIIKTIDQYNIIKNLHQTVIAVDNILNLNLK
uniref:Global nitrogen transcriptional regulator n=1 Tax=Periphykon beckeri TaxID=2006982 RepID=A0A1Z1M3J4_9FLOR|nr:global nitrogen transcriptional regulator [Periphykon beckeri]ARW60492.1 global nitrogen transcriptional regulator [Periphykon beckeri]